VDILTHAGVGLIAASPLLASRPELALGVVAGSVLPDLDAFCRLWDQRAFLRAHQTWSHALPVQLAVSLAVAAVAALIGWNGLAFGGGLLVGLIGHSLLDLSNTFGVAWFTPFSRRRFCLEWVFFIDALVLAAVAVTLWRVIPIWLQKGDVPALYAEAFFAFLSAYFLGKGVLRRRAGRFSPKAKSLVPSALVPWRFFGTQREQQAVTLFRVDALTGAQAPVAQVPVLDELFAGVLETLPEFTLMREISPEYHVVSASADGPGTRLLCRDLRMRNFGTRFGDLEVWLDASRQIAQRRFHV
jgi:membrane-bound metal-dependent hydrolase YbcI (DUF457 family)